MSHRPVHALLSCLGIAAAGWSCAQEAPVPDSEAENLSRAYMGRPSARTWQPDSRLGFNLKGNRELGGGLNANFVLQTGLALDDGGYGYNPLLARQGFAPGGGQVARIDNATRYEAPVWGGFHFGVQGGFGEIDNEPGSQRSYDTYARYAQGPVDIAAAMVEDRGTIALTPQSRRSWVVGAAYSFGSLRLRGAYMQVNDRTTANMDANGWWVGADYRLGVNLVKIQYVVNRPRYFDNSARSQGIGLGYEYSLSRQTTLYTGLSYLKAQDGGSLGRTWFSGPGGLNNGGDNDLTQWYGGMRFSF
jgi:predicted porin